MDRYCGNCGHALALEDRFCPSCERPAHETAHVPTPEAESRSRFRATSPPQEHLCRSLGLPSNKVRG